MKKFAWICLLSVLLNTVTACGKTVDMPAAEETEPIATETETIPETSLLDTIQTADYDGYTFRITSYQNATWPKPEFLAEELTGEVLNDALFERNQMICELFNIGVTVLADTKSHSAEVKKAVTAGEDAYDLLSEPSGDTMSLSVNGVLMDMAGMDAFHFDKPWWSPQYIRDSSIGGRTYFGLSSCNLYAYDTTPLILFSKDLITDYGMELPYEAAKNYQWTFDMMIEMASVVSVDADGNGIMDQYDKYGLVGNNYISDVLLYGCDITFVSKDEKDLPVYAVDLEYLTDVMDKMLILTNKEYAFVADRYGGVDREAAPLNAFTEKRALFWPSPTSALFKLRDSDVNYGILPVPMFSESQGHYTSFVTTDGTVLSIPITCGDSERNSMITEAFVAASFAIVKPAYYDITLSNKLAQDKQSSEMLDLIQESYVCDIGNLLRSSGLSLVGDLRAIITREGTNVASTIAAKEKSYRSTVESIAEKIINMP